MYLDNFWIHLGKYSNFESVANTLDTSRRFQIVVHIQYHCKTIVQTSFAADINFVHIFSKFLYNLWICKSIVRNSLMHTIE